MRKIVLAILSLAIFSATACFNEGIKLPDISEEDDNSDEFDKIIDINNTRLNLENYKSLGIMKNYSPSSINAAHKMTLVGESNNGNLEEVNYIKGDYLISLDAIPTNVTSIGNFIFLSYVQENYFSSCNLISEKYLDCSNSIELIVHSRTGKIYNLKNYTDMREQVRLMWMDYGHIKCSAYEDNLYVWSNIFVKKYSFNLDNLTEVMYINFEKDGFKKPHTIQVDAQRGIVYFLLPTNICIPGCMTHSYVYINNVYINLSNHTETWPFTGQGILIRISDQRIVVIGSELIDGMYWRRIFDFDENNNIITWDLKLLNGFWQLDDILIEEQQLYQKSIIKSNGWYVSRSTVVEMHDNERVINVFSFPELKDARKKLGMVENSDSIYFYDKSSVYVIHKDDKYKIIDISNKFATLNISDIEKAEYDYFGEIFIRGVKNDLTKFTGVIKSDGRIVVDDEIISRTVTVMHRIDK